MLILESFWFDWNRVIFTRVIPATAGIQFLHRHCWMPAFAGMTIGCFVPFQNNSSAPNPSRRWSDTGLGRVKTPSYRHCLAAMWAKLRSAVILETALTL